MELKRKIEYSWATTLWTSWHLKGCKNLPLTWDGVRHNKFPIATGMVSPYINILILYFFPVYIYIYIYIYILDL